MQKDNNDSYTNSRRLTRKQASMVTSNQTSSNATKEDASVPDIPVEDEFNAVEELMDRQSFQGEPDPEENEVYDISTSDSTTCSSFPIPAKRSTRLVSVASDLSSRPPSISQPPTPAESLGLDTRSSIASAKSESATTPKKSRKKHNNDLEVTMGVKRTRRRTDSLSSENSDF